MVEINLMPAVRSVATANGKSVFRQLQIYNCNSIRHGVITIFDGFLNIKYGFNGVGKSSIAKALQLYDKPELQYLKTYGLGDEEACRIEYFPDEPYKKVMVFNDEYANKFIVQQHGHFADSFAVLLMDDECEKRAAKIDEKLKILQLRFAEDERLIKLPDFAASLMDKIKLKSGSLDKRGSVSEILKGGGAGFDKYQELSGYKEYYSQPFDLTSKWGIWRQSGIDLMNGKACCPFCAEKFKDPKQIDNQNNIIKKVFKKSAMEMAEKLRDFFEIGCREGYLDQTAVDEYKRYLGDMSKSVEIESGLQQLMLECSYIEDKLLLIRAFRPGNVKEDELEGLKERLAGYKLETRELGRFFSTEKIKDLAGDINKGIDELIVAANELKKLFEAHSKSLHKLIEGRESDINDFLEVAGFPYHLRILSEEEHQAQVELVPNGQDSKVEDPGQHLSWGEKHAFALVMFMFEAVSERADLIVLDDPITSFDKKKKFAVMRRLFEKHGPKGVKRPSLNGITTLLLTHDLQPVIDYVYFDFFERKEIGMKVRASFISNIGGIISDELDNEIKSDDIKNILEEAKGKALDEEKPLVIRVAELRRFLELSGRKDTPGYHLLSSLIHGRTVPTLKEGQHLSQSEIDLALKEVRNYIKDLDYNQTSSSLSVDKLLALVKDPDLADSDRSVALRVLFNRRSDLTKIFSSQHDCAWKIICESMHIENDNLFQLMPDKIFTIPDKYRNEIYKFLDTYFL